MTGLPGVGGSRGLFADSAVVGFGASAADLVIASVVLLAVAGGCFSCSSAVLTGIGAGSGGVTVVFDLSLLTTIGVGAGIGLLMMTTCSSFSLWPLNRLEMAEKSVGISSLGCSAW